MTLLPHVPLSLVALAVSVGTTGADVVAAGVAAGAVAVADAHPPTSETESDPTATPSPTTTTTNEDFDSTEEDPEASACATLYRYETLDCSGEVDTLMFFSVREQPGSECVGGQLVSVNDQYCDLSTGHYFHTAYSFNTNCETPWYLSWAPPTTRTFTGDECINGFRLKSCEAGRCSVGDELIEDVCANETSMVEEFVSEAQRTEVNDGHAPRGTQEGSNRMNPSQQHAQHQEHDSQKDDECDEDATRREAGKAELHESISTVQSQ